MLGLHSHKRTSMANATSNPALTTLAGRCTTPHTPYDSSGPPKAFGVAALKGDLGAIRAAGDWYRDRGQPTDPNDPEGNPSDEAMAYFVEVYACEMEVRQAQGKLLRVMLSKLQPAFKYSPSERARRPSENAILDLLEEHGLASPFAIRIRLDRVKVSGPARRERVISPHEDGYDAAPGRERWAYRLDCPTDHTEEEQTRSRLIEFLRLFFRTTPIRVAFENHSLSWGGLRGRGALGI